MLWQVKKKVLSIRYVIRQCNVWKSSTDQNSIKKSLLYQLIFEVMSYVKFKGYLFWKNISKLQHNIIIWVPDSY